MSLMARVDQARSRLQATNEQLSRARGLNKYTTGLPDEDTGNPWVLNPLEELSEIPGEIGEGVNEAGEELGEIPGEILGEIGEGVGEAWGELLETPGEIDDLLEIPGEIGEGVNEAGEELGEIPGEILGRMGEGVGEAWEELSEIPGEIIDDRGSDDDPDDNDSDRPHNWTESPILSSKRYNHILNSDSTGGGHGKGRNIPGKSEFPWEDEQTIEYVEDVATDPDSTYRRQDGGPLNRYYDKNGDPVRFVVEGFRDGHRIRVITEPAGEGIITAFPPDIPPNQ